MVFSKQVKWSFGEWEVLAAKMKSSVIVFPHGTFVIEAWIIGSLHLLLTDLVMFVIFITNNTANVTTIISTYIHELPLQITIRIFQKTFFKAILLSRARN